MVEYIYFVKCADCEDEPFEFFDKAKDYALSCMSKKPVITQTEVNRNDFGECVDSCDLGTIWSWEEAMSDIPDIKDEIVFSKTETFDRDNWEVDADLADISDDVEEYDFFTREPVVKRPLPADVTIESLVEEMEENEDMVECKECYDLYAKQDCTYEEGRGYICYNCQESTDKTDLNEEHKWTDTVELYYPSLTVRLAKVSDVDNYYDPRRVSPPEPDVKEFVYSDEFVYNEFLDNVLLFLAEDCITAEDIKHFGSSIEDLDSIDDGYAYQDFAEKHYDYFYDKYETEILNKFKDNAIKAFGEHCEKEGIGQFLESCEIAEVSLVETLEESEDYRARLFMCPECGDDAFDPETGICINCGFN